MMNIITSFFEWYEKNLKANIAIATFLFLWQLVHLAWLTLNVVLPQLLGTPAVPLNAFWETVIVLVDYTEIPALISVSLIYINELRKHFNYKSLLYLAFLNSQWLHIFWITDEFVVERFAGAGHATLLPLWLAWVAIFIDYLELPVMYDTIKRTIKMFFNQGPIA